MKVGRETGLRRRRWTRKEFYRLLDLGFFNGQRVELIGGQVFITGVMENIQAMGITATADALNTIFGKNYWVRTQMSLDLKPHSVADPDVAVIQGGVRTHHRAKNPMTALLAVEVSESTYGFYKNVKGSLYARAGIEDYWILNLNKRQLEVRRRPMADTTQPFGYRYADLDILDATEFATPLAMPQARIAVADLLP